MLLPAKATRAKQQAVSTTPPLAARQSGFAIAKRSMAKNPVASNPAFVGDFSKVSVHLSAQLSIQPRRSIDTPGDPLEREADLVADTIKGAGYAVNGRSQAERKALVPVLTPPLTGLAGAGRPLPPALRADMENHLSYDLSSIRVHTNQSAAAAASRLGALAFTYGRDLVFGAGQFQPDTSSGRWLVAHELTHAIQQAHTSMAPRVQRRTAAPIRNDKDKTFTYMLEVYTVSGETLREAQAVRDTLNAFKATGIDPKTGDDYTVHFLVRVYPPPDVDVLEKHFDKRLRYRYGKQRIKKRAYQRAAQNYWVETLKQSGNRQNLYLGENKPTAEVKEFLSNENEQKEKRKLNDALLEAQRKIQASPHQRQEIVADYKKQVKEIEETHEALRKRFNNPDSVTGSRGTTFEGTVIQMRPPVGAPGTEAFQHNTRLHEFMHLLGLDFDYIDEYRESMMSYPYVNEQKHSNTKLTPTQSDIDTLVYEKNPPPP